MSFKLRDTENIVILGLFLAGLGLLAALVIAAMSQVTAGPIGAAAQRDTVRALARVLPEFDNEPVSDAVTVAAENGNAITFYRAFRDGALVGVAGENVNPRAYGGPIKALISLEPSGRVRTVLVTAHNETPGLGSVVCDRKEAKTIHTLFQKSDRPDHALPANPILDQFAGRLPGERAWKVTNDGGDFNAVTGSTITSRAVTELVWSTARAFERNREAILTPPEKKP